MNSEPHQQYGRGAPERSFSITPAGVVGTLVLALAIVLFVRLGFWQLERRAERRALNESVRARLDAPALADAAALEDTVGIVYRAATVGGTLDVERSIVLPGRSFRGVPGVYLLSPLRLDGRDDAVLVNRGWVPSADAATIDVADFDTAGRVTIRGLVLPFPGTAESLAQRPRAAATEADGFRRVWFSLDEAALRRQYPYRLLPAMVQQLPAADGTAGTRYPRPLEPPPLDEGPHLGYALQWFSFALIGVIGWLALASRGRAERRFTQTHHSGTASPGAPPTPATGDGGREPG